MGYFTIGMILAILVGIFMYILPFIPSVRLLLKNEVFEDTILGEAFEEMDGDEVLPVIGAHMLATVLWVVLTGLIWVATALLWPLLLPVFMIGIVAWRNFEPKSQK